MRQLLKRPVVCELRALHPHVMATAGWLGGLGVHLLAILFLPYGDYEC
jgi:hypothetical protein